MVNPINTGNTTRSCTTSSKHDVHVRLNSEKAESPVTPNISRTTSTSVASVVSNAGNTPPSLDEKRMRREIANSNERRRMQSINAGFQSLRTLLPHHEGEKLSKAAILQQTADYIYQLEQERTSLLQQNCHLKRIISQHEGELASSNSPPSPGGVPSKKRKTTDSSDEEIVVPLIDDREGLRMQLDRERALRIHLEEKVARLESLYPVATTITTTEKLHENLSAAEHITIQFKEEPKEETIILSSSKGGSGIVQSLENGRRMAAEIQQLQQSSTNMVNVVTETKPQRVAATSATTSVILQPVTHEESLLPSAIINGHQYAVSPTTAVVPVVAGKQLKPKVEVERLPSPTSVSLTTTIAATRLTNTSTTNSSTRLLSTNTSPSHQAEQMSPVSASADVFTIQSHSRQNLEAIVEAIRHLEGDSAFDSASTPSSSCSSSSSNISMSSDSSCCNNSTSIPSTTTATGTTGRSPIAASAASNQEAPLALTKRTAPQTVLQVDMNHMNSFVRFHPRHHTSASGNGTVTTNEQQQRPGVIVVKQQT
ncbi:helix-loop-helix protein 11 isoform X2 [Planococcus citri]|uniref:helix-loop-helix protein 11 isoform X2 n=1 Tax=Planococcus citri TaxID=170843 RepID=UPI0031F78693